MWGRIADALMVLRYGYIVADVDTMAAYRLTNGVEYIYMTTSNGTGVAAKRVGSTYALVAKPAQKKT